MIDITVLVAFGAGVVVASAIWLFASIWVAAKSYRLGYLDAKKGKDPYGLEQHD